MLIFQPMAKPRFSGGKVRLRMELLVAKIMALPRPCRALEARKPAYSVCRGAMRAEMTNTAMPAMKTSRQPTFSVTLPTGSMNTMQPSKKDCRIQARLSGPAP